MNEEVKLPELPAFGFCQSGSHISGYTADQMRAYGEQCRLATTEQPGSAVQGEVVAYRLWNGNGWDYSQRPFPGYAAQPLYTTPPPAPAAEQSDLP